MAIEPAGTADAAAIAGILSDWIDATDWMPRVHDRDEVRGFGAFLIDKTDVLVARDRAGRVVGFAAHDGPVVHALYLAGDARGRRIGAALLDRIKGATGRIELWTFQANSRARRFYAREGLVEVELTDGDGNDEKLPDVRMIWQAEESHG